MVPTTGFMRALRSNAIALLGSDVQATKELFQLLDAGAASDYRFAKALLQGRKTLPWKRDWQEKRLLAAFLANFCSSLSMVVHHYLPKTKYFCSSKVFAMIIFLGSLSRVGFQLLFESLEVPIPSSYGPTPHPMPLAPRTSIPR